MNIVRALFPYTSISPLHWVTFDTESGQMIDCSINPTRKDRQGYQDKTYRLLRENIIGMRSLDGGYEERKVESITKIKIGEIING